MAAPIPTISEGFEAQCQNFAVELAKSPEVRTFTLIKGNAKAAKTFAEHKLREQAVKIQAIIQKWPLKSAQDLWSSDALLGLQKALRSLSITCVKAPKAKTVKQEEMPKLDKTQQTIDSLDESSEGFKSYAHNYKMSTDHEALEETLTNLDKDTQTAVLSTQLEEEVARTQVYIETFFKGIPDRCIHIETLKALDEALLRSGYMLEKYQMTKEELLNQIVDEALFHNPASNREDITRPFIQAILSCKKADETYDAEQCLGATPIITQYIKSLIQEHQTTDEINQAMTRDLLSIIDRLAK